MVWIAGDHGYTFLADTALETFGIGKLPIILIVLPANGVENAFIFVIKTVSVIDFVQVSMCNVQNSTFFEVFGQDKISADWLCSHEFKGVSFLLLFRWWFDRFISGYHGYLHIAGILYFVEYLDKGELGPIGKTELDDTTALNACRVRATSVDPFSTLIPYRKGWRILLGFP